MAMDNFKIRHGLKYSIKTDSYDNVVVRGKMRYQEIEDYRNRLGDEVNFHTFGE